MEDFIEEFGITQNKLAVGICALVPRINEIMHGMPEGFDGVSRSLHWRSPDPRSRGNPRPSALTFRNADSWLGSRSRPWVSSLTSGARHLSARSKGIA